MPERNLHLTLAFFEEIGREDLEEVDAQLQRARLCPVRIEVSEFRSFGVPPRLIAADVIAGEDLAALHVHVHQAIHRAGVRLKSEKFRPHITLRRFRRGDFVDRSLPALNLPGAMVHELGLWQSTLTPAGARYDLLTTYNLGDR